MNTVSLGDRMKLYEGLEANRTFIPTLPILVRLDGKSFHSFTCGLNRPYDERLSNLMRAVTKQLVVFSSAKVGYTQSDEITLILQSDDIESQVFFDGSIFKTISVLASFATAAFNKSLAEYLPEKASQMPLFDCRAWNVPSKVEAVNCLIWREQDAVKNSISMAAQSYFSHNQLMNKTGSDKQEMLFSVGVNWNDYPTFFKRGVYFQRRKILRSFTPNEIEKLPLKHQARSNPNLQIKRTEIVQLGIQLSKVTNRCEVIFEGQEPVYQSEQAE